jgi:pantoate kinase
VKTKVKVDSARENKFRVLINGAKTKNAPVSEYVLKMFSDLTKTKYEAYVDHEVQVPVGSGFGSSGAAALSLALALNRALKVDLTTLKAAQMAHLAEIDCQTGLGTVTAEFQGGFEIRLEPGAPGIGETRSCPLQGDWRVVCLNFNPISKKILKDQVFRRRTNEAGRKSLKDFTANPTPERFMSVSRSFSEKLGFISDRVRDVLTDADGKGFTCSMMMIGEAVFSLIRKERTDEIVDIFRRHSSRVQDILIADIDFGGARLL